ncbi:MAG: DUF1232 domain-containing protein [Rikenellaceae bacterium]|nr:DUF1232 domain-containing protein [Rikenellaceae bacterium]
MALKFIDKLKTIDLSKASEAVSGVKSSFSNLLDKKKATESTDTPSEDLLLELSSADLSEDEQTLAQEYAEKFAGKMNELQEKVLQYLADNSEKLKQWYSDSQINEKIAKVAKKAGGIIIYPVLLLFNLMKSPQTTVQNKMFIVAPLAYFVLPTDLIPDFIVAVGYADDGLAIMKCVQSLSSSITPEIKEQTTLQCKGIFGEVDEKMLAQISDAINDNQEAIVSSLTDLSNKSKTARKNSTKPDKENRKK